MTNQQFNIHLKGVETYLKSFAIRLTRDHEKAKDLVQETLLRCFAHKDRFKEGTNFNGWATTIMYHSFINDYRKNKVSKKIMQPLSENQIWIENISTDEDAQSKMQKEDLEKIFQQLSERYRTPLKMYIQGYHYDEISTILGVSLGTIKSRIFHARKKLKKMIDLENAIRLAA